jgi:MFS family permease
LEIEKMNNREANSLHGILIILAAVMPVLAIVSLVPVLPALEAEFAHVPGSEFLVPIALTIPAFCLAVFSPAAGWLADRIGRKSLLVVALFLYAIVGVTPYFLTDLKQIIASRFLLGIVEAAIMTVATTLIGDYFKGPAREKWFAIQVASISVAGVFLVFVAGILGGTVGSRGPFLLYLLGLPIAILCLLVLFEPASEKGIESHEKQPLPLKRLMPLVLAGFVFGNLFYITIVKMGDILALVTEVSPQLIGQVSAICNGVMIIGTIAFGLLKSRINPPAMLTVGFAIIACAYFIIASSSSLFVTAIGCALVTIGSGICMPTFLNWIMSFLSLEVRGRGTGMWQGAFFLGQFISPIFIVLLEKQLGSLPAGLVVMAITALLLGAITAFNIKSSQTQL